MIVVGKISVKAILKHQKRPISKLYMRQKRADKDAKYILGLAKSAGIPVEFVSDEVLCELTQTKSHGGVAVECEGRTCDNIKYKESMLYMCVEGLSDPYNMGEVLRTVSALGFDGVITPTYDFYEHEAKLIRASAGASESLVWHFSDDLAQTLTQMGSKGVRIVGAHRNDTSQSLTHYTFNSKSCIVIGGAYRGLSRNVLDTVQDMVRLDYDARVSLSTVGAVSVFAYAAFIQKEGNS
ncbi:RNA methyltransferase [Erysipelothrix larvae]|uniref:RNA methyltransferase n=1 Tax=Erysipelothrix larvae TaxID=1514105 RepID=A0A0X8GYI0_9FIRM|nr:RNA methyltransferase [Erysipelothrix larvae]AMC92754.1 RNA methyltransferase [Erysipelothrix larvae]